MALVAYDFKWKTKDIAFIAEKKTINHIKERNTCEALIQRGLLGPELALRFQPAWRRYLHAEKRMFIWRTLIGLPRGFRFWPWS